MTDTHLSDLTFSALELAAPLMQGIDEAGFTRCTPIQAQTLPSALTGRDIAGQAQTGTGKTAAFLVALFQNLLARPAPATRGATSIRALVIAPTRELAVQIHKDAVLIGQHTGLRLAVVFGGVDYEKQRRELEGGIDVLIGTPGRLNDVMTRSKVMVLKRVELLVLDEADRLLSMGFTVAITAIIGRLPKQRRHGGAQPIHPDAIRPAIADEHMPAVLRNWLGHVGGAGSAGGIVAGLGRVQAPQQPILRLRRASERPRPP